MSSKNHNISCVLYADDDPDDSMLFSEAIKLVNLQIKLVLAENEKSMNEELKKTKPDLIFLDLNMPGRSGKECLKAIRANYEYKQIPVIIYSTSNASSDIDECYRAGADYYVIKPYSFSDIIKTLQKIFAMPLTHSGQKSKQQFVLTIH